MFARTQARTCMPLSQAEAPEVLVRPLENCHSEASCSRMPACERMHAHPMHAKQVVVSWCGMHTWVGFLLSLHGMHIAQARHESPQGHEHMKAR